MDTRTGKILWTRRDLKCDHHEGPGSSLLLDKDRLYFNVDGRDVQYVIALDAATGKTVWKTNRSVDYSVFTSNQRKAFCTPILIEAEGRRQLFSPGAKAFIAYDPEIGRGTLEGQPYWLVHGTAAVVRSRLSLCGHRL